MDAVKGSCWQGCMIWVGIASHYPLLASPEYSTSMVPEIRWRSIGCLLKKLDGFSEPSVFVLSICRMNLKVITIPV